MRGHAVVLGASMGGLLAARVLRNHFRQVTVLERDKLPELGESRKGVPQDRHAHALLARGAQVLEGLFPGFIEDMKRLGAQIADVLQDGEFVLDGQRLPRQRDDDMISVLCTRPLLEGYLRQRLFEEGSVRFQQRCEATGLLGDFATVRGVRMRHLDHDSREELLEAELVIDATGRGSRLASWLEALGHPRPAQERIEIGLGYVSALYRRAPGKLRSQLGTLISVAPPGRRSGVAIAVDREHFLVTLAGYLGEWSMADHASMRAFARGLPAPDLAELLDGAEPVSEPVAFKYPHSQRLRYERASGYPAGALAFADALCSFNPVYGQGMTVAALEAELLDRLLARGKSFDLTRAFYREAARVIDGPWAMSTGADLRFADVEGARSLLGNLMNAYFARLVRAARTHPPTARRLLRVLQLVDEPSALLAPPAVVRALFAGSAPRAPLQLARDLTISGVHG
jgi:2-polyprenyl-6-methoxyphenol hydroxylase-like FAD-dependent oxidoreductase